MTKCVLVIGASGDVGQGMASQLLQAGYRVIAAGRSAEKLKGVSQRLASAGALETVVGSVEDEATAQALRAAVQQRAGRLDAVITSVNAPLRQTPLEALSSRQLIDMLNANLVSHLMAAQTFVPVLPVGATYLAIGGGMADFVVPGYGSMSMCQAAQRAMFRMLAEELKGREVRIRELMIHSMVAGHSNRDAADPRWITDEDIGRHVVTMLAQPEWFAEPIVNLKSRKQVGLQPVAP